MNKLNPSQAEQLKEIAAHLQQKRIEQSLSLEQIASRTLIRLHILEALEAGRVADLPELIYIQGFIRRYGEALNIDGNNLAKKLSQTQTAVALATTPESLPKKQPQPSKKSPAKGEKAVTDLESSQKKLKIHWFYLPPIGLVVLGLFYIFLRPSQNQSVAESETSAAKTAQVKIVTDSKSTKPTLNEPTPQVKQSPVVSNPKPSTVPVSKPSPQVKISPSSVVSPTPKSSANVALTESKPPLSVAVALEGTSWLRIEVDGKREYEGILEKGKTQTWQAKEKLTIRAGNAGAVNYSVNQKPPQKLGQQGEVKEVSLSTKNE